MHNSAEICNDLNLDTINGKVTNIYNTKTRIQRKSQYWWVILLPSVTEKVEKTSKGYRETYEQDEQSWPHRLWSTEINNSDFMFFSSTQWMYTKTN